MDKARIAKVLELIAKDMAVDANNFDGRPFNGRTVAEYLGHQGAAIATIARIVSGLLVERGGPAESKGIIDYSKNLEIAEPSDVVPHIEVPHVKPPAEGERVGERIRQMASEPE